MESPDIIGHGLIANAFKEVEFNQPVIIFASGVSDSTETRRKEFEREKNLFNGISPGSMMVYFSTCSFYDSELVYSPYVQHKLEMEKWVQNHKRWMIFRLPLVIGPVYTSNTLVNVLYRKIKEEKEVTVWSNAMRYPVDIEDVRKIVLNFIKVGYENRIINIAHVQHSVMDFVNILEEILNKRTSIKIEPKGSSYYIPNACFNIQGPNYLENTLRKYYKKI